MEFFYSRWRIGYTRLGDTFLTIISSLTLAQSLGNAVNDWSDAIQSIALFSDSTRVATGGVVSTNQIVFSTDSPCFVHDDSSANLTKAEIEFAAVFVKQYLEAILIAMILDFRFRGANMLLAPCLPGRNLLD
ncbi:MAG: hypothetical protein IPK03_17560 [Bacteroidetes bacterium]|nr:hypothetical protein [Bacteroidota bacterium]